MVKIILKIPRSSENTLKIYLHKLICRCQMKVIVSLIAVRIDYAKEECLNVKAKGTSVNTTGTAI